MLKKILFSQSHGLSGWQHRALIWCAASIDVFWGSSEWRMWWRFIGRNTGPLCPPGVQATSRQFSRREGPQMLYIPTQFLLCSLLSFGMDFSHLSCPRGFGGGWGGDSWKRGKLAFSVTRMFSSCFPVLWDSELVIVHIFRWMVA